MSLDNTEPIFLQPSSILELLNNPKSKIEDVLTDNITFRLFNTGDPRLVRYFCDHVKDLLRLAFKLTDPTSPKRNIKLGENSNTQEISEQALWRYEQLSSRSFAILEHSDPTLTEAMLSNDQLRDIASSILWENNPESVLLSRLSSLTLVAFLYNPSIAQSSCGYVLQMLNYVSEPSILSLFEIVCSSEDRNVVLQQWLLSLSFTDILYSEIEDIQKKLTKSFDTNNNRSSPSQYPSSSNENLLDEFNHQMQMSQKANQYCGLLKIVTFCSKSLVLSESVRTHRFVELLNQDYGILPQFIEDIRWESISSMYCNQTSELLRGFFNPAINILQDSHLCTTLSGISAIKLLTTMAQNDLVMRPFMSIAGVTKLIIKLMIEHPDHSFLHMAAKDFLQALFMHPKSRKNAMQDSLPAILEASKYLVENIEPLSEPDNEVDSKTTDDNLSSNLESNSFNLNLKSSDNSSDNSQGNILAKVPANSAPSSLTRNFKGSHLNLPTSSAPSSLSRNYGSSGSNSTNSCLCPLGRDSTASADFNIPAITEFNASLRASLFTILNMAINLGKADQKTMTDLKMIPGLLEFAKTTLADYNSKLIKFYGGSAPPPQICNAKDMANDSVFRMRGF